MAGKTGHAPGGLRPMAATDPAPPVDDAALRADPHGFELFAALRLLERVHRGRPRLGESNRPSEDAVRLRQPPSLAFAAGDIAAYAPAGEGVPATLDTYVLGLFGPNGPLPLHLTEYAIERMRSTRDHTLRAFADVFHHRVLALFYRAWADAQPVVQGDRPEQDRFRFHLGALAGIGPCTGDAVVSTGARHYAGRMLCHARNAEGLRALLRQAFAVPVQLQEFIGEWMPLPDAAWLRLGRAPSTSTLGATAVLGARVRGGQHRFRLLLGPLDGPAFRSFLPGGRPLAQLAALVRAYVGDEQAWDVQLVLRAADVPAARLGQAGRLGLDTWLGRRSRDLDHASDVVVRPAARAATRH